MSILIIFLYSWQKSSIFSHSSQNSSRDFELFLIFDQNVDLDLFLASLTNIIDFDNFFSFLIKIVDLDLFLASLTKIIDFDNSFSFLIKIVDLDLFLVFLTKIIDFDHFFIFLTKLIDFQLFSIFTKIGDILIFFRILGEIYRFSLLVKFSHFLNVQKLQLIALF